MDISSIVATERVVEIKHPATDEPIGLTVTLRPDSHPEVKKARREWTNERLKRGGKVDADKVEALNLSLVIAAVGGWDWGDGDLSFKGEKPDFTPANLRAVLKELPWVRTQLDEAAGDDAAFFTD